MSLENLRVYELSMKLGEEVWTIVSAWDYFQKDTVGKQLMKAVDSIAANISEGHGRYHYKESKNFNYFARGSLFETKTWLTKAASRNMISKDKFQVLMSELDVLGKMLNSYINSIGMLASHTKIITTSAILTAMIQRKFH
jgi:four helix bundle protein